MKQSNRVTLGVDSGFTFVGLSAVTEKEEIYSIAGQEGAEILGIANRDF